MTLKLRALAILTPLLLALPTLAQDQDQDQPAVAFGNGNRMVRGTVTAVTPDHLTLKTESGELYQVAVTPNTQVRKGRDPVKFAEVHPGDGVGAMGEVDKPNKTVHALMLMIVSAEQIKKMREDMGKTYITGKITAIAADDLKLTILRSDGVSQTIAVDEGTSFKRGGRGFRMAMGADGANAPGKGASLPTEARNAGESITLADIKVGDLVGGPGSIKNGTFIPTELDVADPNRRRRSNADTLPPPKPQ